jgi:hypothetical protein
VSYKVSLRVIQVATKLASTARRAVRNSMPPASHSTMNPASQPTTIAIKSGNFNPEDYQKKRQGKHAFLFDDQSKRNVFVTYRCISFWGYTVHRSPYESFDLLMTFQRGGGFLVSPPKEGVMGKEEDPVGSDEGKKESL